MRLFKKATQRGRIREKDKIEVAKMPSVVQFRSWKIAVRNEVAAASGRGDIGLTWIMEVEKEGATFVSLADSGSFTTLDIKQSAALTNAITGDVG